MNLPNRAINAKFYKALKTVFYALLFVGVLAATRILIFYPASFYLNHLANDKQQYTPSMIVYGITPWTGDFMEPWKAPYNAGTSAAQKGDYDTAQKLLELSLAKVDNAYGECYIRANLAYTYEKQGDYYTLSESTDTAKSFYDKAVSTVKESPAECFPPEGGSSSGDSGQPQEGQGQPDTSGTGESMKNTEESSQEKSDKAGESQNQDGTEQVQKDMQNTNADQQNKQDEQKQQNNSDGSSVDKPW